MAEQYSKRPFCPDLTHKGPNPSKTVLLVTVLQYLHYVRVILLQYRT